MTRTEPRLLIIGFSNVATTNGFSVPTIERLQEAWPGLEAFRVGLGALQPQVIPPFIQTAAELLGPFTHVLLEINSSAYAMHPLSTEENGRELLADILLTVQDCGAEAAFMLHLRHWTGQVYLDFDALVRRFCAELDLPLIDLSAGWIERHGADQIAAWMRDETHTTKEGGEAMAETLTPFLTDFLRREPSLTGRSLPRPRLRRGVLSTAKALSAWPRERHDCLGLSLDFARIEGARRYLSWTGRYGRRALCTSITSAVGAIPLHWTLWVKRCLWPRLIPTATRPGLASWPLTRCAAGNCGV
ncbi:hypothetical protein ACFQFQ_13095 [Sulfitobacter porphyrae]|uniref:SGNH hydrolase-type esterase domain-containing protein n=1 Tax=Sulfitobacter porphyrae TaxID=1246864 RepID=A0ABW2B3G6_9RHOB